MYVSTRLNIPQCDSVELLPSSSTVLLLGTCEHKGVPQCDSIVLLPSSLSFEVHASTRLFHSVWFYCTFTIIFEVHTGIMLFHSVILLHFYNCLCGTYKHSVVPQCVILLHFYHHLWGTYRHNVVPQCDSVELLSSLSAVLGTSLHASTMLFHSVWFYWTFTIVFEVHTSTKLFHSVNLLNFDHHCLLF